MPDGGTVLSIDPVSGEPMGSVDAADPSAVRESVAGSRHSRSKWDEGTLKGERVEVLRRLVRDVGERAWDIALTVCKETGRPVNEVLASDVLGSIVLSLRAVEEASSRPVDRRVGPHVSELMGNLSREVRLSSRPLGVVAIVSSCSHAFGYPFCQAMAALASGNAVVIKPSPRAPLTAELIRDLFDDAGVPSGVVRVVHGGRSVGHALTSAGVDVLVLQGKPSTAMVARETMPLQTSSVLDVDRGLDMVVMDDANIDTAARAASFSIRLEAGQSRWSLKRLFVEGSVMDEFLPALCDELSGTMIGHSPGDPDIGMGPMLDRMRVERAERAVGGVRTIRCGLAPEEGPFMSPMLLMGPVGPVRGPVATVSTFDGVRGAMGSVRGSAGAAIGVWTRSVPLGVQLTSLSRAAFRFVNHAPCLGALPMHPALPSSARMGDHGGALHRYDVGTLTITESEPGAIWWGRSSGTMRDALMQAIHERSARMDPLERVRSAIRS